MNDIEDFILFAQAKLNLTKVTSVQYSRRVKAFLKGRSFVTDRDIDIFQGRAPKNVLAKNYNPHGIRMLKEIYEKANFKIFEFIEKLRKV